jgi:polysaccharide pyruvyl transferase WcaK-like protein
MKNHKGKRINIAFFGHFDSTNFGNESTLQAILYHLRRFHPDAEVVCISSGPEATTATHQIEAIPITETFVRSWTPRNPLLKVLRKLCIGLPSEPYRWAKGIIRLRRVDTLIIPGTGLLTDAYGLFNWGPYSLFKWSLIAKLCHCKLLLVSIGAGPLHGTSGRYLAKAILRLADFRSYRDNKSREYLRTIGFRVDNDLVYPDLAFSLPETLIPHASDRRQSRPVVGLGVMEYAGRYSADTPDEAIYTNYIEALSSFAGWLLSHDYNIRLLSGDVGDKHTVEQFKHSLRKRLPGLGDGRVIEEPITSVDDLLSQVAATDIVVATRFHNVLFGLLCNKPVISISFHHKCESLMRAMGLSDYCLNINNVTAGELIEKFCGLERNADKIKVSVGERAGTFRKELDEQYELIFRNA